MRDAPDARTHRVCGAWRRLTPAIAGAALAAAVLAACADDGGSANGSSTTDGPTLVSTSSPPSDAGSASQPPPIPTEGEASVSPTPTGVASLPEELVGAWCGGSSGSGNDTWIFGADGTFTADEQVPLSGVAHVQGDRLILDTNEMGVHERTIAMDRDTVVGDILYLDGYSYVRGECN